MVRRTLGIGVAALLACAPTGASAHELRTPTARAGLGASGTCDGGIAAPDRVIAGELSTAQQGSYVQLPFDVPAGTTAVRVAYCWDRAEAPTRDRIDHTLDLGLYDARPAPGEPWGNGDFRGWGGSSHRDVWISNEGFTSGAQVPGKTTRGFLPGPVEPGEWAAELGVAAVVPQSQGDADGKVRFRVEVAYYEDAAFADEPYAPAAYDATPARSGPGWYAGDFHVHAEHSSFNDATMEATFKDAFGRAGLDFITLSDYVTSSAWGEIGRHQPSYPGKLIARSAEVITYRGHVNNHGSARYVDYRTGPVREWRDAGDGGFSEAELVERRGERPASAIFDDVHAAGGYTQINHPTIFPSKVPPFAILCRGCSWEYSAAETDFSKVDAIEIATGPAGYQPPPKLGPNPFTPLAIEFWEDALRAGHRIAAVGSSDSHHAGSPRDPITQSPIGQATTVVYADELSEEGIQRGVEARHTYVKVFGNDGPDLRFSARRAGDAADSAIMGDELAAPAAEFTARVLGGGPGSDPSKAPGEYQLLVVKDGVPIRAERVVSDPYELRFADLGPGRYRLQLMRGTAIEAVTSPIWLVPPAAAGGGTTTPPPSRARPRHPSRAERRGRARSARRP
jgi:hypothetical protein